MSEPLDPPADWQPSRCTCECRCTRTLVWLPALPGRRWFTCPACLTPEHQTMLSQRSQFEGRRHQRVVAVVRPDGKIAAQDGKVVVDPQIAALLAKAHGW